MWPPASVLRLLHSVTFGLCEDGYGSARNQGLLDTFTTRVTLFNDLHRINDNQALLEFVILLTDDALTRWEGVKCGISTWIQAVEAIHVAFALRERDY